MNFEKNSITKRHFFDTYAFLEIIKGNPNYKTYEDSPFVLTKLNLFELYNSLLREVGEEIAEKIFIITAPFVIDLDETIIREAVKLKIFHTKKHLSMTDCIGYILSKRLNVKFLTGDKEFEFFENVEFVK